jgi:ribosomal-protein-alanine N-acetyltransferase
MNDLQLTAMQERHLAALARLEAACFSSPWSKEGLRSELTNPCAYFLVAENASEVLGYAGMHVVCGEAYLANIAVFPAARSRGVGRALLRALSDRAQAKACEFLTLEVRPSNQAALALYRSEGFQVVGQRRGFYTAPQEDALIMTKTFGRKASG